MERFMLDQQQPVHALAGEPSFRFPAQDCGIVPRFTVDPPLVNGEVPDLARFMRP